MKKSLNLSAAEVYTRAAAIGLVAGLRAMTAPALISYAAAKDEESIAAGDFLARRDVAVVLGVLAFGELIGDKLPNVPNRTEPLGLAARITSGAFAGGYVCAAQRRSVPAGIIIGAVSAVAAAYAGENIRRAAGNGLEIPDAFVGAGEDTIAVAVGIKAVT